MFNFVKDVTALTQSSVANGLDATLPRYQVLVGSSYVLIRPNAV